MPDSNQLIAQILALLKEASGPLMAKEIAALLREKYGLDITRKDVNSLLYGKLSAQVEKDSQARWSLAGHKKTFSEQAEVSGQSITANDPASSAPMCPICGEQMILRTAKRGPNAGGQFFGCSNYPHCKGTMDAGVESISANLAPFEKDDSLNPVPENKSPSSSRTQPSLNSPVEDILSGNTPSCPECGAPMQIRTARQGANEGCQFYGCTRYPQCKATLSIDKEENGEETGRSQKSRISATYPRRVAAFPSATSVDATYFESVALPAEAVTAIASDAIPQSHLLALSQWQLDIPQITEPHSVGQTAWLPVVEKILKRGRAVPLCPSLESELRQLAACSLLESDQWEDAVKLAAVGRRQIPDWNDGFGSDEERHFVEKVLPAICGRDIVGWVQRQVSLDALVGADEQEPSERRVDFLIAHPGGVQLVIEIDGAQHESQVEEDQRRDRDLLVAGYEVIRIPVQEIREGAGQALNILRNRLSTISFADGMSPESRFLTLARRAHQLQISLWYAYTMGVIQVHEGKPVTVAVLLDSEFGEEVGHRFIQAVLEDLNELIADVASLYGETEQRAVFKDGPAASITVSFRADYTAAAPKMLFVRDVYLPLAISTEVSAFAPANATDVTEATCERLLRRIFGFDTFREGQFEAISRCLSGKDAIVLLPTGAGKSIAFQLAALLRPGVCIVIDPIISLIEDQIENLRSYGIDRVGQITSAVEWEGRQTILGLLGRGEYQFCYVAPERFQDQKFRNSLRILTTHTAISLVTIDEAHCVSEWGHDFRPAYLNIARISRDYCATDGMAPPLMALTGTASRAVLKDVQRELQIGDYEAIITPSTFDRAELHFKAIPCRSDEKILRLQGLLESLPRQFGQTPMSFFECRGQRTCSGLVFCPHVGGDFGVVRVSEQVARSLSRRVPFYSGTAPKGVAETRWRQNKTAIAREFKQNQVPLMACTKAFGMGIDKPNIRYTVHFGIPSSIEAFYQEAGRAGRDRRDAQCLVLYSNDFPARTRELLNPSLTVDRLHSQMETVNWDNSDDITRVLWFHANSFAGAETDYQYVIQALEQIGNITQPRDVVVEFAKEEKTIRERAIHRLLTIGVISDYTVNYSAGQFLIRISGFDAGEIADCPYRYIAAYQRGQAEVAVKRLNQYRDLPLNDFVCQAAWELIQFVYEVIERSRRQALSEMLALCEQSPDETAIRKRILTYLGTSGFTTAIDEILDAPDGGLDSAIKILEEIRSAIDAGQLRGESGRALESYPDHSGLRLVRAISEAMSVSPDRDTVTENVEACVRFACDKYGLDLQLVLRHVMSAARLAGDARPELADTIIAGVISGTDDKRAAARTVVQELPLAMIGHGITTLLDGLTTGLTAILED